MKDAGRANELAMASHRALILVSLVALLYMRCDIYNYDITFFLVDPRIGGCGWFDSLLVFLSMSAALISVLGWIPFAG